MAAVVRVGICAVVSAVICAVVSAPACTEPKPATAVVVRAAT
ncbi:hypothetical protein SAMN05421763_11295 [[Luteovulum] sphaeroides subsp. megalophilum]|nr:hypothetical protein SAMN05421763_11295 [[Luteovulum] sphaeroides subsp. megalophilum]